MRKFRWFIGKADINCVILKSKWYKPKCWIVNTYFRFSEWLLHSSTSNTTIILVVIHRPKPPVIFCAVELLLVFTEVYNTSKSPGHMQCNANTCECVPTLHLNHACTNCYIKTSASMYHCWDVRQLIYWFGRGLSFCVQNDMT